ncbi:RDD family protein [Pedobacter glucosidilyticus]|uniref:RDD family protein n=1 Tax=Pedobacter glucosidilyticus TaxID=1122941 RepID=UPI0026EE4BA9|nr:RDD family protein [Pedobacter glucosidilyticus]
METKIYTLVIKGKPEGPFSLEELKALDVKPDAFVRKPGMDDYKEAHEFEELRSLLGFKQQFTAPQYFAGFDLRLLATAIDWFLVLFVVAVAEFIYILAFDKEDTVQLILLANLIVLPLLKFVYQIITETKTQFTIGKRLLNIKVTNLDGLKPSFNQILIRNTAKIISALILFMGYFYSFLNKKQQCLHDVWASTLVIKERLI